ncbi:MAG: T9SS type A sorting domain-containing protein [Bacteroidota bacterium]
MKNFKLTIFFCFLSLWLLSNFNTKAQVNYLLALNLRTNINTTTQPDTLPAVQTIIYFNPNASDGYNSSFDVPYFPGTGAGIWSAIGTSQVAINVQGGFTYDRIIRLGVTFPTNPGTCRFTVSDNPEFIGTSNLILEDTLLNIFHDLRANPNYNVNLSQGTYLNRFKLHLGPSATASYTSNCTQSNLILTNNSSLPVNYYVLNTAMDTVLSGVGLASNSITNSVQPGTYYVAFTRGIYSSIDTVNVISQFPNVDLGPVAQSSCQNLTLNAGYPGATYLWLPSGATTQTIDVVNSTNNITVTVTNVCGTSTSNSISVTINPDLPVDLGSDVVSCNYVLLDVLNQPVNSSYVWSDENGFIIGTSQSINVLFSGVYSVLVSTSEGCSGTDYVNVTIENSFPAVDLGDSNQSSCQAIVLDAGNSGNSYVWSTGQTTQTIEITSTTNNISVDVTNSCGTTTSNSVNLGVFTPPVVNLGPNISQCEGIVTLDAQNTGQSFLWNNASTSQTIETNTSGVFAVIVSDGNGCSSSDSINVIISSLTISGELIASSNIVDVSDQIDITFNLNIIGIADSIVWDFGDGDTLHNSLSVNHFFATEGVYDVTATIYNNACTLILQTQIIVSNTTSSTFTSPSSFQFKLLENKFIEITNVKKQQNIVLDIYSIDGKLISSEIVTANQNSINLMPINENLNSGLYVLKVKSNNFELNKKFIVSHN